MDLLKYEADEVTLFSTYGDYKITEGILVIIILYKNSNI